MRTQVFHVSFMIVAATTGLLTLSGCPKVEHGTGQTSDGGSATVAGQNGGSSNAGKGGSSGSAGGNSGGSAQDGGTAGAGGAAGSATSDADAATSDAGGPTPGVPGTSCDLACDPTQHCEWVQVQCIRAPCPPQPTCLDNPSCGGFAARPCPGLGQCVDDPRDSCDPQHGGADCGGICSCEALAKCKAGQHWDKAKCACADAADGGGAVTCGKNTCAAGEYCCNASCGICAPKDGACTQQLCQ